MSNIKKIEENDLEEIRKGFEMFDINQTGKIIPSEMKEAMDAMNIKDKNPFIYDIIDSLCLKKEYAKNGLSLDALVNYVQTKINDFDSNSGLRQLFDALCGPNSKTITLSTFYQLSKEFGDNTDLSENDIKSLLEKTQMGGEELTFNDFCDIMKETKKSNNDLYTEVYRKKKSSSNGTSVEINFKKNKKRNIDEEEINDPDLLKSEDKGSNSYRNKSELGVISSMEASKEDKDNSVENFNQPKEAKYVYKKERVEKGPSKYEKQKIEIAHPRIEEPNLGENLNVEEYNREGEIRAEEYNIRKENFNNELQEAKEIESVEKSDDIVQEKPFRGSRYRYSRKAKEERSEGDGNSEEPKSSESMGSYKVRRPINQNKSEKISEEKFISYDAEGEKKDIIIPKRYHRRYRENKISAPTAEKEE